MKKKVNGIKGVTILLPDAIRIPARIRATKEGKSLSEVIRGFLKDYGKEEANNLWEAGIMLNEEEDE